MSYVYILRLKNNSYYTGACRNITKRLSDHLNKRVSSTKSKLPFTLIYLKEYNTYSAALTEEYRIKSWKKRKSIENLVKFDTNNIANSFAPVV